MAYISSIADRPKRQIWSMLEDNSSPSSSRPSTASSASSPTSPAQTRERPDWDLQEDLEGLLQQAQQRELRIRKWKATLEEGDRQLAEYKSQSARMVEAAGIVREVQRSLLMELAGMGRRDSAAVGVTRDGGRR